MNNLENRAARLGWLVLALTMALFAVTGCDDSSSDDTDALADITDQSEQAETTQTWTCDEDHDDWRGCSENKVQYCHILEGMDPHFHWLTDCESLGYSCVEEVAGEAVCVDYDQTCDAGSFSCDADSNTAYNCVDGHLAVEPCGTSKTCHEEDDEAHCEEVDDEECGGHGHLHDDECHCNDGYIIDEDDPMLCIAEVSFPEQSCQLFENGTVESKSVTTVFDEVFSADTHADLDLPVSVTLPAGEVSYIHFPCPESGEFVFFLTQSEMLDGVLDKDGNEILFSGGVPNGMCEEVLVDHYHADLTNDAGETIPFVLRFAAPDTATELSFMVRHHEEDEDHEDE